MNAVEKLSNRNWFKLRVSSALMKEEIMGMGCPTLSPSFHVKEILCSSHKETTLNIQQTRKGSVKVFWVRFYENPNNILHIKMLKGSLQIYFLWCPVLDLSLVESCTN